MAGKTSASGPKKKKKNKQKMGPLRVSGAVLGVIAALICGAYLFFCTKPQEGKLLDHTYINDVDLSGMTAEEANAAVLEDFRTRFSPSSANVSLAGETYSVPLWDEEGKILSMDPAEAINSAMELGHGSFLSRGFAWLTAEAEGYSKTVAPAISGGEALDSAIRSTGIDQVNTAVDTSYTVNEDSITIVKGAPGVSANVEALSAAIVNAFQDDPWQINYQLDAPTDERDIAALDLRSIYDEVHVEAANATVDPENDYAIVPAVTGVSFDVDAAVEELTGAAEGSEITVPLVFTDPEISTEFLTDHLFADKLGSYTTTVSGSSGRRKNVDLAAQRCNGVVLLPGQTFSYNETVGQRTKERGFSEAGAYVNGETVDVVGGGICQVSSTLYAACLYSNLEITDRINHSFASSYIGLGLDATVSWGAPDYKFTNNTAFPIKISAGYSGGKVTVSIYGTKLEDFKVEIVSEVLAKIPYDTRYEYDSDLDEGEEKTVTTPYTGYKVQTYRKVYDGSGNLISNTPEAYNYYRSRDRVIAHG